MKKRELVINQIELQKRIQQLAKVNVVTCGHCGTVLYHDIKDEEIVCFDCENILDIRDCPDFWFDGCEDNPLYQTPKTNEISVEDVIRVAEQLNINPSILEITQVIQEFSSEVDIDPTPTWDLIIENLLYSIVVVK